MKTSTRGKKGINRKVGRLSEKEMIDGVNSFLLLLKTTGEYFKNVGELQKRNERAWKVFSEVGSDPSFFLKIMEKLPVIIAGRLVKIFSTLMIVSQTKDFFSLPPDKKIEIGKALIKSSEEMNKLIKELQKEGKLKYAGSKGTFKKN